MIYPTNRVLHIDDDLLTTRFTAALLGKRGIDMTALNDPAAATPRMAEGGFHIVITDLQMPRINGFELLRRIKAFDGGAAVIVLTGLISPSTVLCALRQGAAACFFKPLTDVDGLIEVINDYNRACERWRKSLTRSSEPHGRSYAVRPIAPEPEAALATQPAKRNRAISSQSDGRGKIRMNVAATPTRRHLAARRQSDRDRFRGVR